MSILKVSAPDINVEMVVPQGAVPRVPGGPTFPVRRSEERDGRTALTTCWRLTPRQIEMLLENGGFFEVHLMADHHPPIAVQVAP
jgi:hypothetical protein